jgi:hypothetical protein
MIARIQLFPICLIDVLHYTDIAFKLSILVITEILSSNSRIKKSRICVEFIVFISFDVVFSKNLPAIIQENRKRRILASDSYFTLFHVCQKELKSRKSLLNRVILTFTYVGLKKNYKFFKWP